MKQQGFLLIIAMAFATCTGNQSRKENGKPGERIHLKVAAYNVEFSSVGTSREIGEALKSFDFDAVAFSEAPGGNWTKETATVMGMKHTVTGRYSTAGHKDKYKTIASKTPLYGYEEIFMTDTLHTVTKVLTKIGDMEIALYAVHFPFGWRDQAHIDETTAKISSFAEYLKARQGDECSVVMGDFNFIPTNPGQSSMYHEMFKAFGLDVSWNDLEIDVTRRNTYNALDSLDEGNGQVIDHIMYNPEKVMATDGGIIEMENPLSDHKPVWALLELRE